MNMNNYLNKQDKALTQQVKKLEKLSISKETLADKIQIKREIKSIRAIQSTLRLRSYALCDTYDEMTINDDKAV